MYKERPMTPQAQTLATTLAEAQSPQGTLVSLILRKKGVTRGPRSNPTVYGDDLVHVLLWTGFSYSALAQHSLDRLNELWGSGQLVKSLIAEAADLGYSVTIEDATIAVQEVFDRLRLAATPSKGYLDDKNLWEPLVIGGQRVRGVKVYVGGEETNNPMSPKPGTLYIDGLKLGEVVLDKAPHGNWDPAKQPKTVVKDLLKSKLPIGRYVRYSLAPENLTLLKVGAAAVASAKQSGITVNPNTLRDLFPRQS